MTSRERVHQVAAHYGRDDLEGVVLAALRGAGQEAGGLLAHDLAPLDQFHVRGEAATQDLMRLLPLEVAHRVLDIGGGVGGSARLLASRFRCHVAVVDVSRRFVRLGTRLTRLTGLEDRVRFVAGCGTAVPVPAGAFDAVLVQHAAMNVADKARLFAEAHRVLRPGGWLGVHEIVAGPEAPLHFPVPWASAPGLSWLCRQDEMRATIRAAGFDEQVWIDDTGRSRRWLQAAADRSRPSAAAREPGVHLLVEGFDVMLRNLARNVAEGRAEVVLASARRSER